MTRLANLSLSILLFLMASAPVQTFSSAGVQGDSAKPREGSISGRLVNEVGQPIPNATVRVWKAGIVAGPSRSVGTVEDGRFRVDDLAPGVYGVWGYVPGYVPTVDSGERQFYRLGESVTLSFIKGGVITGTVTNSLGEPVVAARVSAVRIRDVEGRPIRRASPTGVPRQTDDRGVYRLYGLQPGTYLVVVNGTGGGPSFYAGSAYDGDAPTYYPSTTRDVATEVTLHAGEEVGAIDIRYRGGRGHIVSGTISGAGSESSQRSISVALTDSKSGATEAGTYVPLRQGRGFALHGVADGEYELLAWSDVASESPAASAPRRITVKGSDVTGIELALAPLASVVGRVILETQPRSEEKEACKDRRRGSLDETLMVLRGETRGGRDQANLGFPANEAATDERGDFKIHGLFPGRYRVEARSLAEDFFIRTITAPGSGGSKLTDIGSAGLAINKGQRVTDLRVTLGQGAASLRGKVVSATEGIDLPSYLRVHLVPAETKIADDAVRFAEAAVDGDGFFSLTNLAPGQYYIYARVLSDDQRMERNPQPVAWDVAARVQLHREAQAANTIIELQQCQRVSNYVLKFPLGSVTTKPGTKAKRFAAK